VHDGAPSPLTEAWHFEYGGPTGGSPLRIGATIYFDGNRLNPGDPMACSAAPMPSAGDHSAHIVMSVAASIASW
jgi:hypothetical protein